MGFQPVQHWTNDCEPLLPPLQPIDYSDYTAKKRGSTTKTKKTSTATIITTTATMVLVLVQILALLLVEVVVVSK